MQKTLLSILLYSFFSAGCGGSHAHDEEEHEHVHEPMFGGQLIECGDHEGNVELVADTEDGELVFYLLDGHAVDVVRSARESIDVEVVVGGETLSLKAAAQANPLTGDSVGDSSQFSVQHDKLKGAASFTGTIKAVDIQGSTYEGLTFEYPAE